MTDLRLNEIYGRATVQGEGPYAGRLCTFVRLYGCNLNCRWCDTPFTWDTTGRNGVVFPRADNVFTLSVDEVMEQVVKLDVPICVVSGGEPMLQSAGVFELAKLLHDVAGIDTHVETNGTRPPPPVTGHPATDPVDHWSVSPKLRSADAGHAALNVPTLERWARHPRAIFKIVCGSVEDVREAHGLMELVGVPNARRWIMPEGKTVGELASSQSAVVDCALEHGLNISPRLHVSLWGNERGR